MKIFVIEDNRSISELICMNLEAAGYETFAVYDGLEAKNMITSGRAEDAALALVDVMLPGKDGFALMEDLQRAKIPVIYLTAKADVESKVHGLKNGAEDYIVKPFEILVWKNPYRVETEGARFVELLSFEQIQDIFRKMLPKKYEGLGGGGGQPVKFAITEIRLGYMRSREEKDTIEATLIPVWDFYGTRALTGDLYDVKQAFYPWLTINAMDGTVIER